MGKAARLKRQRREVAVQGMLVEDQVLDLYMKLAPQVIYRELRKDCCLNATRILIDVLDAFGIGCHAVATRTMVFNAEMWRRVREKGDMPTAEEMDEWVKAGAWALGADGRKLASDAANSYPWHLVGVTRSHLIDSSSAQMDRPEKEIVAGPVIVINGNMRRFEYGGQAMVAESQCGTVVSYSAAPEERSYMHEVGFQKSSWNVRMAREIASLIAQAGSP